MGKAIVIEGITVAASDSERLAEKGNKGISVVWRKHSVPKLGSCLPGLNSLR